jgi:DNA-binding winged helix-turn-helix (wHTH) protein
MTLLEFGPFRVDPRRRELRNGDAAVPLPPKVFDVLLTLLGRPGETVSKDEIMQAVWQDTFVEEGNLTQSISLLRKALGESGSGEPYIVTVPKQGYRFVGQVAAARTRSHTNRRWWWIAGAAAGIFLLCAAAVRLTQSAELSAITAIAVLPFADVSPQKDMDAAFQKAEAVDPMAPNLVSDKIQSLSYMRRFDESVESSRQYAGDSNAGYYLGRCYLEKGRIEEAIRQLESVRNKQTGLGFGVLGAVYVHAGRRAEALRLLEEVRASARHTYIKPSSMAQLYIGLGDLDEAFRWLDRAYDEHDPTLSTLRVETCWDPVRAVRGFRRCCARCIWISRERTGGAACVRRCSLR